MVPNSLHGADSWYEFVDASGTWSVALATLVSWKAFPPVCGTFAARQNTSFKFGHPAKAFAPMEEMPSGMETDAKFVQLAKAEP